MAGGWPVVHQATFKFPTRTGLMSWSSSAGWTLLSTIRRLPAASLQGHWPIRCIHLLMGLIYTDAIVASWWAIDPLAGRLLLSPRVSLQPTSCRERPVLTQIQLKVKSSKKIHRVGQDSAGGSVRKGRNIHITFFQWGNVAGIHSTDCHVNKRRPTPENLPNAFKTEASARWRDNTAHHSGG